MGGGVDLDKYMKAKKHLVDAFLKNLSSAFDNGFCEEYVSIIGKTTMISMLQSMIDKFDNSMTPEKNLEVFKAAVAPYKEDFLKNIRNKEVICSMLHSIVQSMLDDDAKAKMEKVNIKEFITGVGKNKLSYIDLFSLVTYSGCFIKLFKIIG